MAIETCFSCRHCNISLKWGALALGVFQLLTLITSLVFLILFFNDYFAIRCAQIGQVILSLICSFNLLLGLKYSKISSCWILFTSIKVIFEVVTIIIFALDLVEQPKDHLHIVIVMVFFIIAAGMFLIYEAKVTL